MDGVTASDGSARKDGLDEFPDEHPTDKQMADWLDATEPIVKSKFGLALRDEIPLMASCLRDCAGSGWRLLWTDLAASLSSKH